MPIKTFKNNLERLGMLSALLIFIIIIAILITLFFVEIPESNNDVVKVIIGVITSGLTMIMYTAAGKNSPELEELKKENQALVEKNKILTERLNHLEAMFIDLQSRVIDKLSNIN